MARNAVSRHLSRAARNARRARHALVGADPVAVGADPVAVGADPVAVGADPVAVGADPVAVGADPVAVGADPVAVGADPIAVGADPIAVGADPDLQYMLSILKKDAIAVGQHAVDAGYDARREGNVVDGENALICGSLSVELGNSAETSSAIFEKLIDAIYKAREASASAKRYDPLMIQLSREASLYLGLGWPQPGMVLRRRCIILDIKGTTTPLSFSEDVLYPLKRNSVYDYLRFTFSSPETQHVITLLRAQVEDDLEKGVVDVLPIPPNWEGMDVVIRVSELDVIAMLRAGRSPAVLKVLQSNIVKWGYRNERVVGDVFSDVPPALEKWYSSDHKIKVYIYSSVSRAEQSLFFRYSNRGDLRKWLSGFFDTTAGNKCEPRSYVEISETLGVDSLADILYVTSDYQEATAANTAGLEVALSGRPGNGLLPEHHGFKTIASFSDIIF